MNTIDLPALPPPPIIEPLDYETILATVKADVLALMPDAADVLALESEPLTKAVEAYAYRELLVRARINDAARAVMLAFAQEADLDQLGANYDVARRVIQPGNTETIPPTAPVYESDPEFRARIPMSLEGYTTAGSQGSYEFHGLSADGDVKDIAAISTTPGIVNVYVLSRTGNGTAGVDLLATVSDALNARDIRPMTDQVVVQSASIVPYTVTAELVLFPGPAADVVIEAATTAVQAYVEAMHRIGYDIARSGIFQALHLPGMVQNVTLSNPANDIVISDGQAAYCTGITVTAAGETNV